MRLMLETVVTLPCWRSLVEQRMAHISSLNVWTLPIEWFNTLHRCSSTARKPRRRISKCWSQSTWPMPANLSMKPEQRNTIRLPSVQMIIVGIGAYRRHLSIVWTIACVRFLAFGRLLELRNGLRCMLVTSHLQGDEEEEDDQASDQGDSE